MPKSPRIRPYKPFPDFEQWQAGLQVSAAFEAEVERFGLLKDKHTAAELRMAVEVASRWAAVDTGAIEGLYEVERGFTFSIAASAATWDNLHALKGADVARAIEDALAGYDLVLDVATSNRPITEVWVRSLHEVICHSQETYTVYTDLGPQQHGLVKGKYKDEPNSPLNLDSNVIHSYASPSDTPAEMSRLVEQLRSTRFQSAHPVLQAAYAHYAFVCVHPFPDGNGRVARAISSVFLYRSPGVPLVIFVDQKPAYISALERADAGSHSGFVHFINERVIDTMSMLKTVLESAKKPSVAEQVLQAQEMLIGRGGLVHQDLDARGVRLMENFEDAFRTAISDAAFSAPFSATMGRHRSPANPGSSYRAIPGSPPGLSVRVSGAAPFNSREERNYHIVVAKPDTAGADFRILRGNRVLIEAHLREVDPVVSSAMQFRLSTVATGELGEMTSSVVSKGEAHLRAQGYR